MSVEATDTVRRITENACWPGWHRCSAFRSPWGSWSGWGRSFLAMKEWVTKIDTALVVGIVPRLTAAEADIARLESLIQSDAAARFTRDDARELEQRIQFQISRLEQALRDLRARGG